MRFLCCPLASHGYVYPMIGIARELRARGHSAAFITGSAFDGVLHEANFLRIVAGDGDDLAFAVQHWGQAWAVAEQAKQIALAVRSFAPDVLLGNHLTLGPLIASEFLHIPVAVLGFAAYLLRPKDVAASRISSSNAELVAWRHQDMHRVFGPARQYFGLPPPDNDWERTPLLGDCFLLQSVPDFEGAPERLPPRAHLVGACLWEPPSPDVELERWLEASAESAAPLRYVQHGRYFDALSFWPLLAQELSRRGVRVAVSTGRMDSSVGDLPATFLTRGHLPQGAILPRAHAVIATANTTAVLGAVTHGLPSLLLPSGSEQPDVAERCRLAGVSVCVDPEEADGDTLRLAVDVLLRNPRLRANAQRLRASFEQYGGCRRAAELLELLGATRAPLLRSDAIGAAG